MKVYINTFMQKLKVELKKHLLKYWRHKGRKNLNHKLPHEKRGQIFAIHERPSEIEDRKVPGH